MIHDADGSAPRGRVMRDELKVAKQRIAELEHALFVSVTNLTPIARTLRQRGFSTSAASLKETVAVMKAILRNNPKNTARPN
jgi:hypothetical protein